MTRDSMLHMEHIHAVHDTIERRVFLTELHLSYDANRLDVKQRTNFAMERCPSVTMTLNCSGNRKMAASMQYLANLVSNPWLVVSLSTWPECCQSTRKVRASINEYVPLRLEYPIVPNLPSPHRAMAPPFLAHLSDSSLAASRSAWCSSRTAGFVKERYTNHQCSLSNCSK